MKKATLILAMVAGFSFSSEAITYVGRLFWWNNGDGTASIRCLGRSGDCSTIGATSMNYVITMYNNGDRSSIMAEVQCTNVEVFQDEDGNTEITYTPLP